MISAYQREVVAVGGGKVPFVWSLGSDTDFQPMTKNRVNTSCRLSAPVLQTPRWLSESLALGCISWKGTCCSQHLFSPVSPSPVGLRGYKESSELSCPAAPELCKAGEDWAAPTPALATELLRGAFPSSWSLCELICSVSVVQGSVTPPRVENFTFSS